jgi:hypothetical protein
MMAKRWRTGAGAAAIAGALVAMAAVTTAGCSIADHFTGENESKQVRAVGVPAEATVVQIWDTGVTVNEDPVVGFLLEVHPDGAAPFQAKTKARISRLAIPRVQPGSRLRVLYDPKDESRVALALDAMR